MWWTGFEPELKEVSAPCVSVHTQHTTPALVHFDLEFNQQIASIRSEWTDFSKKLCFNRSITSRTSVLLHHKIQPTITIAFVLGPLSRCEDQLVPQGQRDQAVRLLQDVSVWRQLSAGDLQSLPRGRGRVHLRGHQQRWQGVLLCHSHTGW